MNYRKWIVAAALSLPMVYATAYADDEPTEATHEHQTVKMTDLPQAVRTTVQRESKGKTVQSLRKEMRNGETRYEVTILSNGKSEELEISMAGKILDRHPSTSEGKTDTTDKTDKTDTSDKKY